MKRRSSRRGGGARWRRLGWGAAIVATALLVLGGLRLARRLGLHEPPASLGGLPLVEVLPPPGARPDPAHRRQMLVLLTGDGGWSPPERALAAQVAARGVPVVVLNSLRYFWRARTPEEAARDLARVVEHYARAWDRPRVALLGYSFGADALPFAVTRLPPAVRARVDGVTLLGFASGAGFEFHLPGWFGLQVGPTRPTAPEVSRMLALGVPVLCVNGAREELRGCPALPGDSATVRVLPTGHRFEGWYRRIAQWTLRHLPRRGAKGERRRAGGAAGPA